MSDPVPCPCATRRLLFFIFQDASRPNHTQAVAETKGQRDCVELGGVQRIGAGSLEMLLWRVALPRA
eukprot:939344-Prymnesium_polylepis.1